MNASVEDRLTAHLRATADDVTVGPASFESAYARGRRRRVGRRLARGLGATLVVALAVTVTTYLVPSKEPAGVAWAGGPSAFEQVREVELPGEKGTLGSIAQADGKLWFSTLKASASPEGSPEEQSRVYVADRDGGDARGIGSAKQVIEILPGENGRLWAVGANGVSSIDTEHEKLGPARDTGWTQAYSAVSYQGDLYVIADAGNFHWKKDGPDSWAGEGEHEWVLTRVDGATGEVVGEPYHFPERDEYYLSTQGTLHVTDDGLVILYNPYKTRVGYAKVSAAGVPGKVSFLTPPSNSFSPVTIGDDAVYERNQVDGKAAKDSYLARYDLETASVTDSEPLVRSRGLETAIIDGFLAARGRVFVNYNTCNGPQCLFELDADTMQQVDGPELYESEHADGPNLLALDDDNVLWVATSGEPTRLIGLKVRDLG